MGTDDTVILIHGYNKDESDMITLKNNLINLGYNAITLNLPTRFKTLEDCTKILEGSIDELIKDIGANGKLHFVGHSMGGLIIRTFLSNKAIPNLGRGVLIATPNQGTKLADMVQELFSPLLIVFKPLKALTTKNSNSLPSLDTISAEIGVIAGRKSKLFLGVFLSKENDGRVEVESVKVEGMKDFIITDYGHKEIHYQLEIAKLVDNFLQKGFF